LLSVLGAAAVAQVGRVALRLAEYRDALALDAFLLGSGPGDSFDAIGPELALAGLILTVLVLLPLHVTAVVTWLLWQQRIRRNAALLQQDDAGVARRRLTIVTLAVFAAVAAKVALYAFSLSDLEDGTTLLELELALDLLVLGLLVAVGITTTLWTREQDRLVQASGLVIAREEGPRKGGSSGPSATATSS
jgi:hypothetical protein